MIVVYDGGIYIILLFLYHRNQVMLYNTYGNIFFFLQIKLDFKYFSFRTTLQVWGVSVLF